MSLNILILGDNGSGKSTAARIVTLALIDAGFYVDLDDNYDMTEDQFKKRKKALKGTHVKISCGQAKVVETRG